LVEARAADAADADGERNVLMMEDAELQEYVLDLFLEADADKSGYLDHQEFKQVLNAANFNLSKKDIRRIMSECDTNDDGVLEYREFLPVMVDIINSLQARQAERAEDAANADQRDVVAAEVEHALLHGMGREELEAVMLHVFKLADADNSGALDRNEFQQCLKSAELGLTRKEINLLMCEADANADGSIEFAEFVPICFEMMVERHTEEMIENNIIANADELEQYLISGFASVDEDQSGKISLGAARTALMAMSRELFGLTKIQIMTLLSEAEVNGEGEFTFVQFVPKCARMISNMVDTGAQAKRMEAMEHMSRSDGVQLLRGFSQDTVMQVLSAAFKEADKDESGMLDRAELYEVLQAMGASELSLTPREIAMLMASVDENEDGQVEYGELVEFMFNALCHLEREDLVQSIAFETAAANMES